MRSSISRSGRHRLCWDGGFQLCGSGKKLHTVLKPCCWVTEVSQCHIWANWVKVRLNSRGGEKTSNEVKKGQATNTAVPLPFICLHFHLYLPFLPCRTLIPFIPPLLSLWLSNLLCQSAVAMAPGSCLLPTKTSPSIICSDFHRLCSQLVSSQGPRVLTLTKEHVVTFAVTAFVTSETPMASFPSSNKKDERGASGPEKCTWISFCKHAALLSSSLLQTVGSAASFLLSCTNLASFF